MAENSKIEWCDHTFNPWIGCTKVSAGCANCYAEAMMDSRLKRVIWGKGNPRKRTGEANWKKPLKWDSDAGKSGKRPRVFCASLADWLDDEVPISWLADLLDLIRSTPNLDWLLLTKRLENWTDRIMAVMAHVEGHSNTEEDWRRVENSCPDTDLGYWLNEWFMNPPSNVWIGTSVENQETADKRIPELLKIPAKVRFLSCEPLLGPVDLMDAQGYWVAPLVDWVICGGESGPKARPMHPDWARSLRDQCRAADVPVFFKQWSGKPAGRLLDDVEHSEFPVVDPSPGPEPVKGQIAQINADLERAGDE